MPKDIRIGSPDEPINHPDDTLDQNYQDPVNEMLASVGQAPVTVLDPANPDVALAYNTLIQVNREIQGEGWTFNQEYDYPLCPDENCEVVYPDNVLRYDIDGDIWNTLGAGYHNGTQSATQASCGVGGPCVPPGQPCGKQVDPVRRDGKLYDRANHTFKWRAKLYVTVVWLINWPDIPPVVQAYITARASAIFCLRLLGDKDQYQMLLQNEAYTRAQAMEHETQQGDYSYFGQQPGGQYYKSFRPWHALMR